MEQAASACSSTPRYRVSKLPRMCPIACTCRVATEVEAGRLKMRQTKGGMDRTDRRPAGAAGSTGPAGVDAARKAE